MTLKIANLPTLIWELGTDCLTAKDVENLCDDDLVSMQNGPMALISVELFDMALRGHYSATMGYIMDQAKLNRYDWVEEEHNNE
jgi:hypothetical protein